MTVVRRIMLTLLLLGALGASPPGHVPDDAGVAPPKKNERGRVIRVHKGLRTVEFWVDGARVRTFRAALGGAPVGDKERQGDSRTPEGEFYVAWKNPKSQFHLFLGLSYPMPRHARAGRRAGRVKGSVVQRVRRAVKKRGIPPQRTPLGGYVGLHGGGAGPDWTLGCIALSDADIEWLYARVRRGDRIVVLP